MLRRLFGRRLPPPQPPAPAPVAPAPVAAPAPEAAVLAAAADGIVATDPAGQITLVNRAALAQTGFGERELIGNSLHGLLHPACEDPHCPVTATQRDGTPRTFVTETMRHRNGTQVAAEVALSALREGGLVAILHDLRDRRHEEDALRATAAGYRDLVEGVEDWIWTADRSGVVTFSNRAGEEALGYRPAKLIGCPLLDFVAPDARDAEARRLEEAVAEKRGWSAAIRRLHADGHERLLDSRASAILDADGELVGWRGVERPIAEAAAAPEPVLSEPAPSEAAPSEAAPSEPFPSEVVPSEVVPAEVVPAEPVPSDAVSSEPVPSDAVPSEAVPSDAVPSDAVPSDAVPSEPVPSDAVPSEPVPSEVVPSEPVPSEVVPSEPFPSEVVPSEPVPSEVVPSDAMASDAAPSDAEPTASAAAPSEVAVPGGEPGLSEATPPEVTSSDEEPAPSEVAAPGEEAAPSGVVTPEGEVAPSEVSGSEGEAGSRDAAAWETARAYLARAGVPEEAAVEPPAAPEAVGPEVYAPEDAAPEVYGEPEAAPMGPPLTAPAVRRPMPSTRKEVAIVRQPIADPEGSVVGYELLVGGEALGPRPLGEAGTTASMLLDVFGDVGIERLAGSHPAWVAITPAFLHEVGTPPVRPDRVVLQLPAAPVAADALAALQRLHWSGYTVALTAYDGRAELVELLDIASIVKVTIAGRSDQELRTAIAEPAKRNLKLVATRVDTPEEVERCRALGFELFQGVFFAKPNLVRHRRVGTGGIQSLRTLAEVAAPDSSFEDLEKTISADVGLSLKLLRYVNSAFFSLPRTVGSVHEALTLLGMATVRRWATVMALVQATADAPEELVELALQRARMCEVLGGSPAPDHGDALFTVGLFSVADALLDTPMQEVLETLPFSEEIQAALLRHEGAKGELLATVMSYERGDFPEGGGGGLSLADAYADAVPWAGEARRAAAP